MSDRPTILTGLPVGTKAEGGARVDFKVHMFDRQIAIKGGRYWWSRTALCPCRGNDQTTQPSPTCALCHGKGWTYFLPEHALAAAQVDAAGNDVELNDDRSAVGIRAIVTGLSSDPADFERFGRWIPGTAKITAVSANRIGYRDRFDARDSTIVFQQLIDCDGSQEIIVTGMRSNKGLQSPVTRVHLLRTVSAEYVGGRDFQITADGTIQWIDTPPTANQYLTLHGEFRPRWIVTQIPAVERDTWVRKKQIEGDVFTRMPQQAVAKLDFLVDA